MSEKKEKTNESDLNMPSKDDMDNVKLASEKISSILKETNTTLITNINLAGNAIQSSVNIVPNQKESKIIKPE